MAYNLREGTRKDYRKLNCPEKLPCAVRTTEDKDKLYAVEVVESTQDSVKIHYVGYDEKFDEWRKKEDIVNRSSDQSHNIRGSALQLELHIPFDHHRELAYSIKAALNSSQRSDPMVRIELPFDLLQFNGGLKLAGTYLRTFRGNSIYGIQKYGGLPHHQIKCCMY